jgi:hypothetical protein
LTRTGRALETAPKPPLVSIRVSRIPIVFGKQSSICLELLDLCQFVHETQEFFEVLEIGYPELTLNLIFQILLPSGSLILKCFKRQKLVILLILVFKYPETAGIIKKSNTHLTLVLESSTMALRVFSGIGWFSTFTENLQF